MANQQQLFSFMEASPVQKPAKSTNHCLPPSEKSASAEKPAPAKDLVRAKAPQPPGRGSGSIKADPTLPAAGRDVRTETRGPEARESETRADGSPQDRLSATQRDSVLKSLRAQVGCVTTVRQSDRAVFSTGCRAIDNWLPIDGLHPSTLTEWIAAHDSAAAGSLAMSAAAHRLRQIPDRPLVIVDCDGAFYPPAAVSLGVPSERMILLRPRGGADAIWAIDQALRSGAVAAVWASLPMQVDDRDARRLQLAAETGRTPGLLVRGFHARGRPSFSEVQFYVSEKKRPLKAARSTNAARSDFETISVTLDRVRGGVVGQHLEVQIDDSAVIRPISSTSTQRHETAAEHLASQLANPAIAKRVAARRRARTAS